MRQAMTNVSAERLCNPRGPGMFPIVLVVRRRRIDVACARLLHDLLHRVAADRWMKRENVVKDRSERKDVRTSVHLVGSTLRLLNRHELRRADDATGKG